MAPFSIIFVGGGNFALLSTHIYHNLAEMIYICNIIF